MSKVKHIYSPFQLINYRSFIKSLFDICVEDTDFYYENIKVIQRIYSVNPRVIGFLNSIINTTEFIKYKRSFQNNGSLITRDNCRRIIEDKWEKLFQYKNKTNKVVEKKQLKNINQNKNKNDFIKQKIKKSSEIKLMLVEDKTTSEDVNNDQNEVLDGFEKEIYCKTLDNKILWENISLLQSYHGIYEEYQAFYYKNKKISLIVKGSRDYKSGKMKVNAILHKQDKVYDKLNNIKLYNAVKKQIISNEKIAKTQLNNENKNNKINKSREQEIKIKEISSKDFLVRNTLFKCFYDEHIVQEIIGVVQVLVSSGEIILLKVPCAYCEECNCYYILKSEYEKVRDKGVILCQVISGKKYYEHGLANIIHFGADESILKINGYNVIDSNNLSDIQRRMILKNILDNDILQAHKIAAYLNTFISLKSALPQYQKAIKKWTLDKEFVLQYENDIKKELNIKSIKIT